MKRQVVNGVDPFHAIGDPSRRQMLHLLSKESLTINALAVNFDMTRPAVSKHIKILYGAGFISIQDIGRERHCALDQKGFRELQSWIDYFDQFWQIKMRKLEELIGKQSRKSKKTKT
jgi:DNA-binding transcriptional ArsR family regulator